MTQLAGMADTPWLNYDPITGMKPVVLARAVAATRVSGGVEAGKTILPATRLGITNNLLYNFHQFDAD
jgi:hypothetical protein